MLANGTRRHDLQPLVDTILVKTMWMVGTRQLLRFFAVLVILEAYPAGTHVR